MSYLSNISFISVLFFVTEQVKIDKDKGLPNVQLANQRRKRPKRRSTGAVQFDNEVIL